MDKKLVSKQEFEISYISYTYKIPVADVKEAIKAVGISRRKVYQYLREKGYTINVKK